MLTRRRFITASIALFSVVAAPAFTGDLEVTKRLFSAPMQVIEAVAEQLFPSTDETPGARRCNAAHHIFQMLESPHITAQVRKELVEGALRLDKAALTEYSRRFGELEASQKERLLRRISETGWGDLWLWRLMGFVFEAVLGDPLYGGNPDGAGWRWLKHEPGLPRPEKAFI